MSLSIARPRKVYITVTNAADHATLTSVAGTLQNSAALSLADGEAILALSEPVTLQAGQALTVTFMKR